MVAAAEPVEGGGIGLPGASGAWAGSHSSLPPLSSSPMAQHRPDTGETMHISNPSTYETSDLEPDPFDEGVFKSLCDLDCGTPLLMDRIKQGMTSAKEAATFLKKRAALEEEYARQMIKLSKSTLDSYSLSDGKPGTYHTSWIAFVKTHEQVGENRLRFGAQLNEMCEELQVLVKEADKTRKAHKDLSVRLERNLADQDSLVDKARGRFDSAAEDLERLLLLKQGESLKDSSSMSSYSNTGPSTNSRRTFGKAMIKLKGPKSSAQVAKQEEDVRTRMGQSSDSYRSQIIGAQSVRQEYFTRQLPRILRSLKESTDELDLGTQYHLARYAHLFETTLVNDGLTISNPEQGAGLKSSIETINTREDFKVFMQHFALNWQMTGQRGPRREGQTEDGMSVSITSPVMAPPMPLGKPTHPTFGIDLAVQMNRDGVEVPKILEKCARAIELHGLESVGIYRLSGTTSRVQRLKAELDRDVEGTDLLSEENLSDINDIAGVLKLWFREMPEPLLTYELYPSLIEAAKIENDRLRHIRLHERVNELPDANYATLKYLMGHLDKVVKHESVNQMSSSNLAIVFGPNLLGPQPQASEGQNAFNDMPLQCKCIETILQHYEEIFVDVEDEVAL